jgi:hypothetical protein
MNPIQSVDFISQSDHVMYGGALCSLYVPNVVFLSTMFTLNVDQLKLSSFKELRLYLRGSLRVGVVGINKSV